MVNRTDQHMKVIPGDGGFHLVEDDLAMRLLGINLLLVAEPQLKRPSHRPVSSFNLMPVCWVFQGFLDSWVCRSIELCFLADPHKNPLRAILAA